jgi:ubiquinone/menaquinone biosynthesis C-methylase UbiE
MPENKSSDFNQKSYLLHEQSYANQDIEAESRLYENWLDKKTTDVWRHLRFLNNIDPLLQNFPDAKWVTIGDGRFGTSANYIHKNAGNALATDIDISLLEIAAKKKWIPAYKYANAEALPFENNEFDFSLCKEAYHHFPRPYIAIYEMLRVSKKAIILMEPSDWIPSPIPRRILQLVKNRLKSIFNIPIPHPDTGNYESIGNYVFSISKREIQKIALGMHLSYIAYKNFDDVYLKGVEQEKTGNNAPLLKKIKKKILFQKLLFQLGLSTHNHIVAIIFKELPQNQLLNDLKGIGFTIEKLPKNPY